MSDLVGNWKTGFLASRLKWFDRCHNRRSLNVIIFCKKFYKKHLTYVPIIHVVSLFVVAYPHSSPYCLNASATFTKEIMTLILSVISLNF